MLVEMKDKICSPNIPAEDCSASIQAMNDTLYSIGGKWKLQILIALSPKPRRFNELQRLLENISARVLSNELKEMELNSFIIRKVDAAATPVVVTYELAPYSHSLATVITSMIAWGIAHREKVKAEAHERAV
jgi:DNA-binding HxlR family transcriptional regulator